MKTTELVKKIKEWPEKSQRDLNKIGFTIELYYGQPSLSFGNIKELHQFLEDQSEILYDLDGVDSIPEFQNSINYIQEALVLIEEGIESFVVENSINESDFAELRGWLTQVNSVFLANSPLLLFLFKLRNDSVKSFNAAYNYLVNTRRSSSYLNDSESLFGIVNLMIVQADQKDLHSNDLEKNKSQLLDIFQSSNKTLKELNKSKNEIDSFFAATKSNNEQRESDLTDLFFEFEKRFKSNKEEVFEKQAVEFEDIKKSYRDKLMLEEPVEQWERRSSRLKKQAIIWITATVVTSLLGLVVFGFLVYSLSTDQLADQIKNPAISIRWSIISIFSVAIVIFLIRTFTKMALSNYHLYRDAQERKDLTYLYLSLKTQGDIPDADRQIILQSLFSRADTGLLKGESGPSMPNTPWDKLTNQGS